MIHLQLLMIVLVFIQSMDVLTQLLKIMIHLQLLMMVLVLLEFLDVLILQQ